ncbi:hypothetical protein TWF694_000932 [Orbilia ellipsospora]|uniref:Uncharacterized protein n=1 Tax=Orbilia ellipsospora TaxID=2528407 RepID=A0AAV9XSP9_9PEZI
MDTPTLKSKVEANLASERATPNQAQSCSYTKILEFLPSIPKVHAQIPLSSRFPITTYYISTIICFLIGICQGILLIACLHAFSIFLCQIVLPITWPLVRTVIWGIAAAIESQQANVVSGHEVFDATTTATTSRVDL